MLGELLLGKYRVSRLLDQGGICDIWLARPGDGGEVVVKALRQEFLQQSKPRQFLRREIHILSHFQHENTVAYRDSSPDDAHGPLLVMEYLRGIDLGTLLHRQGRLTPERAGRLLVQLCDVLGAAHKAGIVHRDIKPGNLMIVHPGTARETLKLMDFGLAKMTSLLYIDAEDMGDNTLPATAGTPEYIAPEQALGHEIDGRGDLYSTGVVLFEMLTGRRPFEHTTTEALLDAHAQEEPPTFAQRGTSHIAPAIEAVVRSCLAKNPEQRPADAADLLRRYESALGKRLFVPKPSGPSFFGQKPSPSAPARPETPPPPTAADRHALRQEFEANMPEAMAMLKLKGFLHDLGSKVIASVPGRIRVRLGETEEPKKSGIFSLLQREKKASAVVSVATTTDLELRMERRDPAQPTRLTITLVMRPGNGLATLEWRNRCQQIGNELKAYLMGR